MARYYTLSIAGVYLTDDGTSGGLPCKVTVRGVEALRSVYTGQTIPSADGTPYAHTVDIANKGKTLEILVEWIAKSILDSIVTAVESAIASAQTIRLIGTGDLGDFDLDCLRPSDWLSFSGEFSNGIIQGTTFRFVSQGTHT